MDCTESDQAISTLSTTVLLNCDVSQVSRFIKKIEKDDTFLSSALGLATAMEEKVELLQALHLAVHFSMQVRQNNSVEIYSDYFPGGEAGAETEEPAARTVTGYCVRYSVTPLLGCAVFRDPSQSARPVSAVSWSLDGALIGVAYCSPEFAK